MLLFRVRSLTQQLKTLTVISHPSHSHSPPSFSPLNLLSFFSNASSVGGGGGGDNGSWTFPSESENIFGEEEEDGNLAGLSEGLPKPKAKISKTWAQEEAKGDIFEGIDKEALPKVAGDGDEWETAEGYKPWSIGDDGGKGDVFGGIDGGEDGELEGFGEEVQVKSEEIMELERQEKKNLDILKGPNRAFGDLIEASGITEDMLDSLILLKDVRGIRGLPPLSEIEDKAIARMNETSTRTEIERKKQEEIANARVRQVDEKGRAYGTGRRKCGIARVWIEPGDGNFVVNDKQFDAYFPILDHRAELLRPFTVTNTLGLWDVKCTVKGGGVSGQVGAIRLGISRALQNWEPGLRPYLKSAGYLTRDSRVVERKKYGKAKARKSFQWVKR